MDLNEFEIQLPKPGSELQTIVVRHPSETFDLELNGAPVSLINNGDNSWSIVEGDITQETANIIGDAIEKNIRRI